MVRKTLRKSNESSMYCFRAVLAQFGKRLMFPLKSLSHARDISFTEASETKE